MRLLVVGCGSIGERHIRNLRSFPKDEIIACDTDSVRLSLIKEKYNVEASLSFEKSIDENEPDAVIICTPPHLHVSYALYAAGRGIHCFIEKPLSHNLEGVDELIKIANEKRLMISVGYNLRFYSGLKLVKKMLDENKIGKVFSVRAEFGQYLPDWRPWQDYRQSYTAKRKMGGGILLDASHEVDYLRWFFGEAEEIFCLADKVSNLEVGVEDSAEVIIKFENGIVANLHLDFLQRSYSRSCKIIGQEGTIVWDYPDMSVKVYLSKSKKWRSSSIQDKPDEMYIREMKHFLECVRGKRAPLVGAEEGKKTLEVILAAKRSAKEKRMVKI